MIRWLSITNAFFCHNISLIQLVLASEKNLSSKFSQHKKIMASFTMTASFLGPAIRTPAPAQRRLVVVTNAAAKSAAEVTNSSGEKQESNNGRRDLMFAAAAAAVCSVAGLALADEPKRGSAEAKSKYAPVCVTMPTARICRY